MNHVPMTRPEEVLSVLDKLHHTTSWVELDGGRILMLAGGKEFSTSDDGGLSWSETETSVARAEDGRALSGSSLVRLGDGGIGLASMWRHPERPHDINTIFHRSDDGGKTWKDAVRMNSRWPAHALQDVMLKTSSGRILLPVYLGCGQGKVPADRGGSLRTLLA